MPTLTQDQSYSLLFIVFITLFVHSLGLLTGLLIGRSRSSKNNMQLKPTIKTANQVAAKIVKNDIKPKQL